MNLTNMTRTLLECGATASALEAEHASMDLALWALNKAGRAGAGVSALTEIVDGIISHCSEHFEHEEGFLRRSGFPDLEAHVSAHRQLSARLVLAREQMNAGDDAAALDAVDVVSDLRQHCQDFDLPAYRHVLENGDPASIDELRKTVELAALTRLAGCGPSSDAFVTP